MSSKPTLNSGIGRNSRNHWSAEPEGISGASLNGFYVSQVMDDNDIARMGRVWVYIPEISATRWDASSLPDGGTTVDKISNVDQNRYDQNLRNGWILISPVTPFSGSDDYRNSARPDGTSSLTGVVNSYGMNAQARIGDFVAVMFANGDPNAGYYIGMVPKQHRTSMVPGTPGVAAGKVTETPDPALAAAIHPAAPIPVMSTVPTAKDPKGENVTPSTDQFRNMTRAGVSADPIRGAGSSGARRESPSYVFGMKTPGWSYDSEKHNKGGDGRPFDTRMKELYGVNSVGHQFVMDDHPDSQLIRMRTSSGAQIVMNDSGSDPFIYIQSASGGTWIEMSDSGDISIYAQDGIHIHSEGDYNLTVGGDMNVGIDGTLNMSVGGDSNEEVSGVVQKKYNSEYIQNIGGNSDVKIIGNSRSTFDANSDVRIGGVYTHTVRGVYDLVSSGGLNIQSLSDINLAGTGKFLVSTGENVQISTGGSVLMKAGSSIGVHSLGAISMKASNKLSMDAGAEISAKSGAEIWFDGTKTYLQSGKAITIPDIVVSGVTRTFGYADIAVDAVMPPPNKTPDIPSHSEIISSTTPQFTSSTATVVPQHQPWVHRAGAGSTTGTSGVVTPVAITGQTPLSNPTVINTFARNILGTFSGKFNLDSIFSILRTGAGFSSSTIPDSVAGFVDATVGHLPVFLSGDAFSSSNKGESPTLVGAKLADVFEAFSAQDLSPSSAVKSYLRKITPFSISPKLNALGDKFNLGFDVAAAAGISFGGLTIDSSILNVWNSFSNNFEKGIGISNKDALASFDSELNKVADFVRNTMGDKQITQSQFDGLVSFALNIGTKKLNGAHGVAFIAALATGDFSTLQSEMYKFVFAGNTMFPALLERRRAEVAMLGNIPDNHGIASGNGIYRPTGHIIKVGKFHMSEAVRNAIGNAQRNIASTLPDGTLFAIAAIESGFNPLAVPRVKKTGKLLSSAAGLFQFLVDTGMEYGLDKSRAPSSNVFDPVANSNAGAEFLMHNYNVLVHAGITSPTVTDLYLAHFLGAGGARHFLLNMNANPSALPALTGFRSAANANPGVFTSRGAMKTYSQVYSSFQNRMESYRQMFLGIGTAAAPSPDSDTSGAVPWHSGSNKPDFTHGSLATLRSTIETSASQAGLQKVVFDSGYRVDTLPSKVFCAEKKYHKAGEAIDIHIGDYTIAEKRALITKLIANGATGLGIGVIAVHVDKRNTAPIAWPLVGGFSWCLDILQANNFINVA